MSLNTLQKVLRGMTNWQNSQWLKHAKNRRSVEEASAESCSTCKYEPEWEVWTTPVMQMVKHRSRSGNCNCPSPPIHERVIGYDDGSFSIINCVYWEPRQ